MAIGYEATEWKDGAQGGTPIDAAALNKMENGISEACAAVDLLNEEGNVTTSDIASKAVTTEKIADGAVGLDQLSEEVRDSVSQVVLYSGRSNTSVTLSDDASNFSAIEVEAEDNDGNTVTGKLNNPDGRSLNITITSPTESELYVKSLTIAFSGGAATIKRWGEAATGSQKNEQRNVYITKVVGYR